MSPRGSTGIITNSSAAKSAKVFRGHSARSFCLKKADNDILLLVVNVSRNCSLKPAQWGVNTALVMISLAESWRKSFHSILESAKKLTTYVRSPWQDLFIDKNMISTWMTRLSLSQLANLEWLDVTIVMATKVRSVFGFGGGRKANLRRFNKQLLRIKRFC